MSKKNDVDVMASAVSAAMREHMIAIDAKDAERYRKIRRESFGENCEQWQLDEFDRAIDGVE